ncbi:hypothetical protein L6452_07650 [Arctium lappa]|uniref:Uncharacterized protein n=1 Tax=Arctium lappa TaxID=4217 RepID=A0ACB9EKS5_ARCLA|nr:hypothetical protein L6452_07650 [Arctium lappa]
MTKLLKSQQLNKCVQRMRTTKFEIEIEESIESDEGLPRVNGFKCNTSSFPIIIFFGKNPVDTGNSARVTSLLSFRHLSLTLTRKNSIAYW